MHFTEFIRFLIGLTGFGLGVVYLISGYRFNDRSKKKSGWLMILGTLCILIVWGLFAFLFNLGWFDS